MYAVFDSLGGVQAIKEAMETHPERERVQEEACATFQTLTGRADAHRTMATLRAEETILQTMASHPAAEVVQEACCHTLYNLAHRDAGIRERIIALRGVELAERAERVQREAASLLLRVLKRHETW